MSNTGNYKEHEGDKWIITGIAGLNALPTIALT